jgi:hypothetical protein
MYAKENENGIFAKPVGGYIDNCIKPKSMASIIKIYGRSIFILSNNPKV